MLRQKKKTCKKTGCLSPVAVCHGGFHSEKDPATRRAGMPACLPLQGVMVGRVASFIRLAHDKAYELNKMREDAKGACNKRQAVNRKAMKLFMPIPCVFVQRWAKM